MMLAIMKYLLIIKKYEICYAHELIVLKDIYTNPMVCQCLPMQALMRMMLLTQ